MNNGFNKIIPQSIRSRISKQKLLSKILENENIVNRFKDSGVLPSEIDMNIAYISKCIEDLELSKTCEGKCPLPFKGFLNDFFIEENKIVQKLTPCKCIADSKGKMATLDNWTHTYFSKEFLEFTLKDFATTDKSREKINIYFEKFIENYPKVMKGLYILGNSGWGKTHALACFANSLHEKEPNIILLDCKVDFETLSNTEDAKVFKLLREKYKMAKILLIDNLGEEFSNIFTRDYVLFPILKYRFKHKKHTIFASRYKYEELRKKYQRNNKALEANRIIDMIKEQTIPVIINKVKK